MNSNNNRNFFGFQLTDPGVLRAKRTLAILSSKLTMNKTLEELKDDYLEPFVEDHTDWCRKVTQFVLEKKMFMEKFQARVVGRCLPPM